MKLNLLAKHKEVQTKKICTPITLIGLDNAGKTCLVFKLLGRSFSHTLPTIGVNAEMLSREGVRFQLFDLGGYLFFRRMFWKKYCQLSMGIIFVIDGNNSERLDEVKEEFWRSMKWNTEAPLLILENKSDLKCISQERLKESLNLNSLVDLYPVRTFKLFKVSIKTGQNLDEAISWFFEKITKNKLI